jgi:ABC-type transport system involved in multi-copper enzyme maturation permease subunit
MQMTLLPVVERELRVAARETNTYRVRFLSAFVTILFSSFSLWMVRVFFGASPIPPRELFVILTWLEFVFVAIAGFSLTCDSISEEKRDATLGLLFLTDLKGYDVVLGKLVVAGVRGFYALLATVPVLALPLMLGGTNLSELARTTTTLGLTLFLSMAVGLAISAWMRRGWTAFGLSASILLVLALVLPVYSEFVRAYFRNPYLAHLIELPSPTYAMIMSFRNAIGLAGQGYSTSLALLAGIAFIAVGSAALVTPHVWKDRPSTRSFASVLEFLRGWKFGTRRVRLEFRRRLLNVNPVFWLSRREQVSSPGLMGVIVLCAVIAGWFSSRDWSAKGWQANVVFPFLSWIACGSLVHLLILLRIPVIAAERFGDDRRSGALELILSTPISIKTVLSGHWMALRRYLAGPIVLALGIHLLVICLFLNIQQLNDDTPPLTLLELLMGILGHLLNDPVDPSRWEFHLGILVLIAVIPVLILDWIAAAWLSTWLSLRVKKALSAPLAGFVLLHLPPWLAQLVIALALEDWHLVPGNNFSEALLFCFIGAVTIVSHQLLCIGWSRKQLYRHFRTAATDRYQPKPKRRWWQWRLA